MELSPQTQPIAGNLPGWRLSPPKSVERMCNKNADAENHEKCCESFKHGTALTQ